MRQTPYKAKYPLRPLGRWVMHSIYDGACWICGTYVELRDMRVDHIIPPAQFSVALSRGFVDAEFNVDGLENLLPSHDRCNIIKSNRLIDFYTGLGIERARSNMEKVASRIGHLMSSNAVSGALVRIEQHIDAGDLTASDRALLRQALERAEETELKSRYDHRWTNIQKMNESMVRASGPYGRGVAWVGQNKNSDYLCPNCESTGPWEGIRCCMCGYRGMPDD
jgi:hypothetical protein